MSRKTVLRVSVPLAIGLSIVIGWRVSLIKFERGRTDWKAGTLPRLAQLSVTNEEIRRELDALRAGPTANVDLGWTHDHVLLMTNEEYLIYASRHGFNNGSVNHLFLARGSDGRWFYSTYHFCNQMAGVGGDEPLGSIDEFAQRYSAREFDGKSDDCLQKTWPIKR